MYASDMDGIVGSQCNVDALIESFVDPCESDDVHANAFLELSKVIRSRSDVDKKALSIQDLVGRMEKEVSYSNCVSLFYDRELFCNLIFYLDFTAIILDSTKRVSLA